MSQKSNTQVEKVGVRGKKPQVELKEKETDSTI
jgi:hypothetical protein